MTRRDRLRDNTREEIKALARQHMAEQSSAAISLAAIARAMDMTTPALYRYYTSRDDLVTALIADSADHLISAMQLAVSSHAETRYADRLLALILAYRTWALEYPVDFQMIFGNPIPDYKPPVEPATSAARCCAQIAIEILQAAYTAGALRPQPSQQLLPHDLHQQLVALADGNPDVAPVVRYLGVSLLAQAHGLVMLELFSHVQPLVGNPEGFYHQTAVSFLRGIGLNPTHTL